MNCKMILLPDTRKGISHDLCTRSGSEICWVGENGQKRTPQEKRAEVPCLGFKAAGKIYANWKKLCVKQSDKENVYYDAYGREVLCLTELFPCFDSYDYMHENRHYRWFFIREKGKVTRVYYSDTRPTIEITEDVRYVENDCLERMLELGWIEKEG